MPLSRSLAGAGSLIDCRLPAPSHMGCAGSSAACGMPGRRGLPLGLAGLAVALYTELGAPKQVTCAPSSVSRQETIRVSRAEVVPLVPPITTITPHPSVLWLYVTIRGCSMV
jgi:hypothetical protein